MGPEKSGKTKIMDRLHNLSFDDNYTATIGVTFKTLKIKLQIILKFGIYLGRKDLKLYDHIIIEEVKFFVIVWIYQLKLTLSKFSKNLTKR